MIAAAIVGVSVGFVIGFLVRSMYERCQLDTLRAKNEHLRAVNESVFSKRMKDVTDEADRYYACTFKANELLAQLKAANLLKEGWQSGFDQHVRQTKKTNANA